MASMSEARPNVIAIASVIRRKWLRAEVTERQFLDRLKLLRLYERWQFQRICHRTCHRLIQMIEGLRREAR
jgi:hypothetical protein